jgi:large subunit ribosomal protein L29
MKIKEMKSLSPEDLRNKEGSLKKELFEMNYLRKVGRVDKPSRFKSIRREIARILTILNERAQDGKKS